jgi:sugar phosphate isomerase/epimerase
MLAEIRELGFEWVELGHNTRISLLPGIQQAVAAREIKIASLHNFCPLPIGVNGMAPDCYLPSSSNDGERDMAIRHTLRTLECASQVGAKVVVLHLGRVPMRFPNYPRRLFKMYLEDRVKTPQYEQLRQKCLVARERKKRKYFDQVCRVLDKVIPQAQRLKVRLGMETRLGFDEIPSEDEADELLCRYGTETLAYWYDNAHAQIKENLGLIKQEEVLERFRGRTAGMHLQDFMPPLDDHLPPGKGQYDFARLKPFATDNMVFSWEIHGEWESSEIAEGARRVRALLEGTSPA